MLFKYSFLFLSLALSSFGAIYSMSFEDLPQETRELLQATVTNNTKNVERILQENPTMDLNVAYSYDGTPWTATLCYAHDNDDILKKLIQVPNGLDAKQCGHLLYKKLGYLKESKNFAQKLLNYLLNTKLLNSLLHNNEMKYSKAYSTS